MQPAAVTLAAVRPGLLVVHPRSLRASSIRRQTRTPRNILPDGWRESNGTAAAIYRNWGAVNHAQCCACNYGRPQAFVQAAPGQPTQAAKAVSAWVYGEGEAPAEPTWANAVANAALRFGRSLTLPRCTTVRQEPHPPALHYGSAGASPSPSAVRFGRSLTLPCCTAVRQEPHPPTLVRQEPHPPTLQCGSAGASPSHSALRFGSDSIHS